MRARLTYLVLSPTAPRRVAQAAVQLLVLLAAIAGLAFVASGSASHLVFGALVVAGDALTAVTA